MLRVSLSTIATQRTIRPQYADHQATPYGVLLDTAWNRATDIYPGMVMCKTAGENVTLYRGTGNQRPWALSALFIAPVLGIDEVALSNTNNMTVWRGDRDAVFDILAPAFDTLAPSGWVQATDGSRQPLGVTTATNNWSAAPGLLTPWSATAFTNGYVSEPFATLIAVNGPTSIKVGLDNLVQNWVITGSNTTTN